MSDIVIPTLSGFEWTDVRKAIKRILETVAPNATVHAEWKLDFDPNTGLGKVTGGMNGKNAHSGFVHCFMIGLAGESENTGDNQTFATVGGGTCDYNLDFAVWGFYDYISWRVKFGDTTTPLADDSPEKNATAFAETERRAFKAFFRMNPTLALDSGRVRYVFPPVLESSDNHPFSNSKRLIVMQNTVRVRVRESFA